jgi:hypothetical protein
MAERRSKRRVRCESRYGYDRLSSQKMSQVYHWLVPDEPSPTPSTKVALAENEKERSHLRPSFF